MKPIKPVHLNDTGAAVSNLHKGLLFIIMHEPGISNNDRQSLQGQLAPEMHPEKFGMATLRLVKILQEQLNSRPDIPKEHKPGVQNGDVDEKTADALNFLLRQLGALS
ncbi:MAG: hypothetical protein WAK90_21830 [Pseudolabrys sp.]